MKLSFVYDPSAFELLNDWIYELYYPKNDQVCDKQNCKKVHNVKKIEVIQRSELLLVVVAEKIRT